MMNPATLAALRGSIAKWQAIVAGTGEDRGTENCPLCRMFYYKDENCAGCPVADRTGLPGCDGTPYVVWGDEVDDGRVTDDRSRALAQAELDFLVSLLPEGEAP